MITDKGIVDGEVINRPGLVDGGYLLIIGGDIFAGLAGSELPQGHLSREIDLGLDRN